MTLTGLSFQIVNKGDGNTSIKKDCFAYKEIECRPECHALREMDCTICKFYKPRKSITNNPYYGYSYKDKKQLEEDIRKRQIEYRNVLF